MKKKAICILIAVLILDISGDLWHAYAKCGPHYVQVPEKDIESVIKRFTPEGQKNLQTLEGQYQAVEIRKSTQEDAMQLFGKAIPLTLDFENAESLGRQSGLEALP